MLPDFTNNPLDEVLNDLGVTFTWQGNEYACVLGELTRAIGQQDIVGFNLDNSCTIVTKKSLFTTIPEPKQILSIGDTDYRITSVAVDEFDQMLIIQVQEITA